MKNKSFRKCQRRFILFEMVMNVINFPKQSHHSIILKNNNKKRKQITKQKDLKKKIMCYYVLNREIQNH